MSVELAGTNPNGAASSARAVIVTDPGRVRRALASLSATNGASSAESADMVILVELVHDRLPATPELQNGANRLTAREREVLELLAEGLANKQIARLLNIELATAKNHVHNLLSKLELSRRGEAAALLARGLDPR